MSSGKFGLESDIPFGHLFGDLVYKRRMLECLTQQELAVLAFGSESQKARVSELENHKVANPSAKNVDAIVNALDISLREIDALRWVSAGRDVGVLEVHGKSYPASLHAKPSYVRKEQGSSIALKKMIERFRETKSISRAFATYLFCSSDCMENRTIIFFDVDGGRQVEAIYGKKSADGIMNKIGMLLADTIGDFPVFRLGSDEFIVVAEEGRAEYAEDLAVKMIERVNLFDWQAKFRRDGLYVSVSCGLAHLVPADAIEKGKGSLFEARRWLTRAHTAMLHAKRYNQAQFVAPAHIADELVQSASEKDEYWESVRYGVDCSGVIKGRTIYQVYLKHDGRKDGP